jgi:hypothetical protein
MTLQERIDAELCKVAKEKEGRERSGLYGASSFGKCFRAQVLNRRNHPPSNPFDLKTLHIFESGKKVHDYIQGFFPSGQVEVKMQSEHFIGYADLVLEDIVYDIKSVNPAYFFWQGFGEKRKEFTPKEIDEIILKKKRNNILQVTHYAMELKKPRIGLVFFSRDLSYGIKAHEWTARTEDYAPILEVEKKTLVEHWNSGELPAKCPRLYDGRECAYCNFKDFCGGEK